MERTFRLWFPCDRSTQKWLESRLNQRKWVAVVSNLSNKARFLCCVFDREGRQGEAPDSAPVPPLLCRASRGAIVPRPRNDGGRPSRGAWQPKGQGGPDMRVPGGVDTLRRTRSRASLSAVGPSSTQPLGPRRHHDYRRDGAPRENRACKPEESNCYLMQLI